MKTKTLLAALFAHERQARTPQNVFYTSAPSIQFSSVQDGIYALGKDHMRPTPSLRSFPSVALETVPMFESLTHHGPLCRPFKEDRLELPLSTPLSSSSSSSCPYNYIYREARTQH